MGSALSTLSSALTKDAESPSYDGNPSEQDVILVREFLVNLFPLELVEDILFFAEYWPCVWADSSLEIDAIASLNISTESTWLYVISPPVLPREILGVQNRHRRVRKVRFEMESVDQGWVDVPPENRGTSWSWFEATIFRASASPCWHDLTATPFNLGASFNSSDIKELFPEPDPNGWHIQSNIVACKEPQLHSVTWYEFEDEEAHAIPTSLKGREGLGHELVRSLEPGDRVMLIAKAKFPGWENHVFQGSIEIYYSV